MLMVEPTILLLEVAPASTSSTRPSPLPSGSSDQAANGAKPFSLDQLLKAPGTVALTRTLV